MSNSTEYIGKIVSGRFPHFNLTTNKKEFKSRPLLIIGAEYDTLPCDFNVLPVSSISKKEHISKDYDLELDNQCCNLLKLTKVPSYIRVHKQSTINSRDVSVKIISDFKDVYPDLYNRTNELHKNFNESLFL